LKTPEHNLFALASTLVWIFIMEQSSEQASLCVFIFYDGMFDFRQCMD